MNTYHIHIQGIVQGVGFRPFVYQMATSMGINGWVNNANDGVHIVFNTDEVGSIKFYHRLIKDAPRLSSIIAHSMVQISDHTYGEFSISSSIDTDSPNLPITPDFALCNDCRKEIKSQSDRRYHYAFTTCTNCGPRYSIIQGLPYDRPLTTMADFKPCEECSTEYHNPLNRRHFSQTNSCPKCGIRLQLGELEFGQDEIIWIVKTLHDGKILAIKGIGGYLLVCDAADSTIINSLRERKHRPSKPFAVMYPSLEQIKKEYHVNKKEEDWLLNEVSPIVLLRPKALALSIDYNVIAHGLNHIGCMIPYNPLFALILAAYKKPIVATSGNISGSPIIYDNNAAYEELASIADYIISNNRDIVIPQDDSVIKFSTVHNQQVILRRSRGLAPTMLNPGFAVPEQNILALGAQMKSSFAYTHKGQVYLSQYLGDMDNYLTQDYFEQAINHFRQITRSTPEHILIDAHPNYFTSQYGVALANKLGIEVTIVYHHQAHFYALLAERGLLTKPEAVLGVVWDGTGYGEDKQIWGGEFFLYRNSKMAHIGQIPKFPYILGDKMAREPRISALAISYASNSSHELIDKKFTQVELGAYKNMIKESSLFTSSMGRLFDAVAALTLDLDKTSFEGEAAMNLEAIAERYLDTHKLTLNDAYLANQDYTEPYFGELIKKIIQDRVLGESKGKIAARFHLFLVNLVLHEASKLDVKKIAFSGGVFQNGLLVDLMIANLHSEFELIFHQRLSPNDENISFGQLAHHIMNFKGQK